MANKAIKEKIPFERCVLTKAQLLELFKVRFKNYYRIKYDNKYYKEKKYILVTILK